MRRAAAAGVLLAQVSTANTTEAGQIAAADPERSFVGQTACWTYGKTCAGDARLYDWQPKDYGQVRPVVFGARNGATLSGRVWFTRAGPARRPGVVIVNGSVQAPETLYWFVAQTLAKAGYVVLTFDPQNQGRSNSRGEAPDQDEGFPAQSDGRPFFDGAQDALDLFLSTHSAPYRPRPSCNSGTSHADKQARRAAAGLNAAFNPAVAADRRLADRDRRALLRRRRRLLCRPARPAREGRAPAAPACSPTAQVRATTTSRS